MSKKIIVAISFLLTSLLGPAPSFSGEFPIIASSTVIGQNYGYPSGTPEEGQTKIDSLDLVTETTFFFKNLEIVDLPVDGETFIGYLAPLRLRYRPHEKVTIEAGAVLGHNFGDDDELDEVEPLVRLAYEPLKGIFVIGGTIIKTHPIHDALYDDVNAFRRGVEDGFQFRTDLEWLKEDLWVNWKVRETSIRSERFEVGNSTQLRFGNFWIDGQLLWAHTGGQKNRENKLENNLSIMAGGSYGFAPGLSSRYLSLIKDIRIGGYYIYNHDYIRKVKKSTGDGFEGRITFDIRPSEKTVINIFGAYFRGDDLLAHVGDPLYSLDEYAQVGTNLYFALPAGLRIEVGVVGQIVEGVFVHTEQLYLSWGKSFNLLQNL